MQLLTTLHSARFRASTHHADRPNESKAERMARKRAHREAKGRYRFLKSGLPDVRWARQAMAIWALAVLAAFAVVALAGSLQ